MLRVAIVASVVCAVGPARADQCQAVDAETGKWALKLLVKGAQTVEFCEPCGDKQPKAPVAVFGAAYKGDEVTINGKGVDLAYVFVQTGAKTFTNLALLVGCPTSGVSPTIAPGAVKPTPPPPPPAKKKATPNPY